MSDGLQIMQENMAALDRGEEMPHTVETIAEEELHEPVVEPDVPAEPAEPVGGEEVEHKPPEHMSEEEWVASGRKAEDYLTQEQFNEVGELRNINPTKLAKQVVGMESTLKEMVQNQKTMLEENTRRVREETIAELQTKKQEAIDIGDTEKAIELHDEISKQQEVPKPEQSPQEVEGAEFIQSWYKSNNDWFNVDQHATGLMNVELTRSERDGLPPEDGFKRAEEKVKKQFPYLFEDAAPEPEKKVFARPTPVGSKPKTTASTKKSYKFSDLPPEVQGMAPKVARSCKMTEEQYVKDYLGVK